MKNKNLYIKILVALTSLFTIFHILILIKVIPYALTWGGRLKSDNEMYVFELISIGINAFFIYILLQKGNFVRAVFSEKTLTIILWIFFLLFSLNTIGNIFAKTNLEKYFTFFTLLNAILIFLINKKSTKTRA